MAQKINYVTSRNSLKLMMGFWTTAFCHSPSFTFDPVIMVIVVVLESHYRFFTHINTHSMYRMKNMTALFLAPVWPSAFSPACSPLKARRCCILIATITMALSVLLSTWTRCVSFHILETRRGYHSGLWLELGLSIRDLFMHRLVRLCGLAKRTWVKGNVNWLNSFVVALEKVQTSWDCSWSPWPQPWLQCRSGSKVHDG